MQVQSLEQLSPSAKTGLRHSARMDDPLVATRHGARAREKGTGHGVREQQKLHPRFGGLAPLSRCVVHGVISSGGYTVWLYGLYGTEYR